jgi:hypothetical protein
MNVFRLGMGVLLVGSLAGSVVATQMPAGIDPTETLTRADVSLRYARNGRKYFGVLMSTEYAVSPTAVVGFSVPYLNVEDPGVSDASGYGDMALWAGVRTLDRDDMAIRLDLRGVIDSSDDSIIGAGNDLLAPSITCSWFLDNPDAIAGAVLAHSFDVGSGDVAVNETELRPYFLHNLGWGSWYELIARLYMDWEDDGEFGWFQEAKAGQMFDDSFGVTVDIGFKVVGDTRLLHDWSLGVSARYLF